MVKRLSLILGAAMVLAATAAFAEGEMAMGGGMAAATGYPPWLAALAIASGFGIALAAFGGALAQGRAAASALDGLARNPGAGGRIQTLLILGLALIESLVIYALVIAFMLQSKIPGVKLEDVMKMIGK
jgi:F-type H+-transporting ATPase subunit c